MECDSKLNCGAHTSINSAKILDTKTQSIKAIKT